LFSPRSAPIVSIFTSFFFSMHPPPPRSTLFPYTTLFRSVGQVSRYRPARSRLNAATTSVLPTAASSSISDASRAPPIGAPTGWRSEEHTSELQSRSDLVCRLLLEKKKKQNDKEDNNN